MSTRLPFHSMTWDHDLNGFVEYRYNSSNAAQADAQPRTVAPQEILCDPSRHQNGFIRSSRTGSNSSSNGSNDYTFSRLPTTSRSTQVIQAGSSPFVTRGETSSNTIDFTDKTQNPSSRLKRYYCDFPDCIDERGKPRSVSRKADIKRHMLSVHGPPHINCEYNRCERKDDNGFRRMDHYREHLRGYHNERN